MLLSLIVSIVGCMLTGAQTLLIILQKEGICLNEGCEIIDSFTSIPPLYFNIGGFFFFLLVTFGLIQARKGSETWKRFVSLLLLAALAGEAVLFSFQLFVAQTFCSYCLIVLALVVLANFFMGIRQVFKGFVIYSTVIIAFSSLDFSSDSGPTGSLDTGTMAKLSLDTSDRQLYLFFSSTCTYCEKVMETLQEETTCNVNFNPIDPIGSFDFPGAALTTDYSPGVNRSFLKHLGIEEIPVLLSKHQSITTILRGEQTIRDYLEQNCRNNKMTEQTSIYSLPLPTQDDSCSVDEECEELTGTSSEPPVK